MSAILARRGFSINFLFLSSIFVLLYNIFPYKQTAAGDDEGKVMTIFFFF